MDPSIFSGGLCALNSSECGEEAAKIPRIAGKIDGKTLIVDGKSHGFPVTQFFPYTDPLK